MKAAHAIKGSENNNQLDIAAIERERELRVLRRAEEEVKWGRAASARTRGRPRVGGKNREAGESTEATDARG